jgi:hypothetical protein
MGIWGRNRRGIGNGKRESGNVINRNEERNVEPPMGAYHLPHHQAK